MSKKRNKQPAHEPISDKIERLYDKAKAIEDEFNLASSLHETWKPIVYDTNLHQRLGTSYAANTLLVIRDALRREMLLALMRIWDNGPDTISLFTLRKEIYLPGAMEAFVERNSKGFAEIGMDVSGFHEALSACREDLRFLIGNYEDGGGLRVTLKTLRTLRNNRFAHNLMAGPSLAEVPGPDLTDVDIEKFYLHTCEIVKDIQHLMLGTAYNPEELAALFAGYSEHFWAGVNFDPLGVPSKPG